MGDLLKGRNLYLIGMMGAGKTTIGRLLSKQLGYGFLDTDAVIVQRAGQPIAELFAERGESAFRQLESQTLSEVGMGFTRLVVATGGGIVLKRENWQFLHYGVVLWLDVPVEQLHQRLQHDTTRPLLHTDPIATLRSLLDQRQPLYAQADVRVTVQEDETPEQVAVRAIEQIRQILKPDADLN